MNKILMPRSQGLCHYCFVCRDILVNVVTSLLMHFSVGIVFLTYQYLKIQRVDVASNAMKMRMQPNAAC